MTGNGRTIKRAKVNFLRRLTKNELSDVEIVDGNFIVTKDGGLYTDFEGKRVELIQSLKADEIFPINKVEIFYDNLDHSDYLGYSWELISQGRVPVGLDVNDTDFNEIGQEVYYLLHGVTAHALGRDHGVMEKVCELCKKARRIGSVLLLQLIHIELRIVPAFLNSGCSTKQPNE